MKPSRLAPALPVRATMGKYALLKARRMRLEAGLFDPGKHFHTEWAFAEAIHKRGMALLESDDQQHVAAALLEKAAAEYGLIKSQTAKVLIGPVSASW